MTPNELRIGNLIKDGNDFEQVTIDHLNCLNSRRCEFDSVKINEEWLLKSGFNIKKDNKFYHKENDRLYVDISNPISIHLGNKNGLLKQIDYIHQLQNLFFALTNQELIFKP